MSYKNMINFEVSVSKSYLSKAIAVSYDRSYYFEPLRRHAIDLQSQEYVQQELSDLGAFVTESNLGRKLYYDPQQILIGAIQPNMILGMLLGAVFIPNDAMDADISPCCLKGKTPEELPNPESLLEHELVHLFDKQITEFQGDSDKIPIPPFFWDSSHRTAIHGVMTTAQKFWGESVFLDMIKKPDTVIQITKWIAEAYAVLVRHFASLSNIKITSVHVGECSSCMVGPDQFKDFVVPSLNYIGKILGPIRLHSCGPSDHILKTCKDCVPNLQSLDLGGETSMAKIRKIFGREFPVSIAPLALDMSSNSPDNILGWANRILEENNNGNLTITYHIEQDYNLDILRALHKKIEDFNQ